MAGVYIHVPFCQSRCIYCDFYSTTYGEEWMARYVSALEHEMEVRCRHCGKRPIDTLYLGGGTPSQLPIPLLRLVFQAVDTHFRLAADAEVTIEANPDDITTSWLSALQDTPVNRISMGIQTFDDALLQFLHRRHDSAQALRAVSLCLDMGYENLSIDLIYGLPGQTMRLWQHDLDLALRLGVTHLSAYALSFEPGTELSRQLEKGLVAEADEELSAQMYHTLRNRACQAGYEHYEISNFCLPGFRSRHNSSYWHRVAYEGYGPGAHSYDGHRTRRWNDGNLRAYISAKGDVPHGGEVLTDDELYDEFIMTGLRTSDGLDLNKLEASERQYCLTQAAPHIQAGRLKHNDGILRLSDQGIFVSNDIISDLMH